MTREHKDTSRFGVDPGGLWAAAAEGDLQYFATGDQKQRWRLAVAADFPADGDITCDPATFMPHEDWLDTTIGVQCDAPELAEAALAKASARMMLVTANGVEFEDWDALEELLMEDEEAAYTVSYISDPERRGDIVGLSNIDSQGERYTWMFRTFLRIVAEELLAAGVAPARIVPLPTERR